MNFEKLPRVEYKKNSLFEVVFQARFPQIIKISSELPVAFQDKLRKNGFPESGTDPQRLPPEIPEEIRKIIATDKVFFFISECGDWKVSLSKDFIALTCDSNYKSFSEFRNKLAIVTKIFDEIYQPSYFNRVGLRYRNLVNNTVLGTKINLKEAIPEHIAPEFHQPIKSDVTTFEKLTQFADKSGHKANVVHVFGTIVGKYGKYQITEGEESYIVDIDCFSEQKIYEVKDALTLSDSFNENVRNIFRWSIGDDIHAAMEPKS